MNSLRQNNKIKILFTTFILSIAIFSFKKISFYNHEFSLLNKNLRLLLNSNDVIERCQIAEKKLVEKYKNETYQSKWKGQNLDKYQNAIINLIKSPSIAEVKVYLPHIISSFFIFGIDLIIVFFWIGYCGCCCSPKCCCSGKDGVTFCGKMSYIISLTLSAIIVVICVASIILISNNFYSSINSSACALYKFTFHFLEGTKDDYSGLPKWKTLDDFASINDKYDQILENIKKLEIVKGCESDDEDCTTINKYINNINDKNKDFENANKNINNVKDTISPLFDTFENLKDGTLETINEYLNNYIDKYCKLGLNGLFAVLGLFSLLSLLILASYVTCSCLISRIIYHFIWNIQMTLTVIIFLVGMGLNIIGIVGKDSVSIIQYVKSSNNLNSEDPLLLKVDNDSVKYIDTCLNGNGDLTSLLGINNTYFPQFPLKIDEVQNNYDKVKNEESGDSDNQELKNIIKNYEIIIKIYDICENIENEINNPPNNVLGDCQFLGSDINIIIDQIRETLGKKTNLLSYIILGESFISALSVFFGLIVVNQYTGSYKSLSESEDDRRRKERERKIRSELAKRKLDSSDIPIKA